MSKVKAEQDKIFKLVQKELQKLHIEYKQNTVELVLSHFDFNYEKSVAAFKSGESEEIVKEWTSAGTKKQRQTCSKASSPKTLVSNLPPETTISKNRSPSPKASEETGSVTEGDQLSLLLYNEISREIEENEKLIKNYESKMENCVNNVLIDYYIKSALCKREEIKTLQARKDKLIDISVKSSSMIKELTKQVEKLMKQSDQRTKSELDCWESGSNRTKEEQENFKNKLITHYECGGTNTKTIKCMIMNKYFKRNLVRAAHIWKLSTNGAGLTEFKLLETDVNNERNGLLLLESIEQAFDLKKLCFIYDPLAKVLRLKLLCNDLRNRFVVGDPKMRQTCSETRKFQDIDGAALVLPTDIYPYRRLLNWHGRCFVSKSEIKKLDRFE